MDEMSLLYLSARAASSEKSDSPAGAYWRTRVLEHRIWRRGWRFSWPAWRRAL